MTDVRPSTPTSDIAVDGLRGALARRAPLLATFLMIPRVEIVEMVGVAGFDAVVFDLEHGPMDAPQLPSLAAAARGAGIYSIARLASAGEAEVAKVLDSGVDGLLVPHVDDAEQAARVVRAGRFPPDGTRSLNPYVRSTRYDHGPERGTDQANARTALIAMLEGQGALDQLDAICSVPGLDGVFVGPVDLSASLGHPNEPEHPQVVAAVRGVLARASELGVATGLYAPTPDAAARWFAASASLVALSADVAMAVRGFDDTVRALKDKRADHAAADGDGRGARPTAPHG